MNHFRLPTAKYRLTSRILAAVVFTVGACVIAAEALARVGGGQSYGGGGSSGGGGGGGGVGALIYLLIRFLLWLTIEYPAIGIPFDLIVIGAIIYWFMRPSKPAVTIASSSPVSGIAAAGTARASQQDIQRAFNQLRRFDPNFSEIIFTDFCYALYGRVNDARGHGEAALDLLSPYLSDQARASLLKLNSPQLKAVQGIIVGAMQVVDIRGLNTPVVGVTIEFEANYTEFTPREGD